MHSFKSTACCEVMVSSIPLLLLLCTLGVAPLKLRVFNLKASSLRPDQNSNADGFVKVYCGSTSLGQTDVYHDSPNPSWGKSFTYERALQNDLLKLKVMDKDVAFDDELGVCQYRIKVGTSHPSCPLKRGHPPLLLFPQLSAQSDVLGSLFLSCCTQPALLTPLTESGSYLIMNLKN